MSNFDFNVRDYEAREAFELIPNGTYKCTCTAAEMRPTRSGVDALSLTWEIDGSAHPDFANRKVWDMLNINNEKEQAREIARRTLRSIADAAKLVTCSSAADLPGATCLVLVSVQAAKDGYEARNRIKGYKPCDDAMPAAAPAAAPAAPRATPIWKR